MDREALTAVVLASEEHLRRMMAESQKYAALRQPKVVREYNTIIQPLMAAIRKVKTENDIDAGFVR